MALVAFATLAPLRAQQVPFPAGNFETDPATHWTTGTTGGSSVTFPNISGNHVARVGLGLAGSGTLRADVGVLFGANSLYQVSVDIASSSLLGAGISLGMEIRDANNTLVAELNDDQLLNLLGITPLKLTNLSTDLNLLDGALTDNALLIGTLRDLLGSLLNGNGDLSDAALFSSLQGLLQSLIGADNSLLTRVTALLEDALDETIVDSSNNPLTLIDLTNPTTGLANIADILSLNLGDPGDSAIANDMQDALDFLLLPGNDGPVENLLALLTGLLGNPGDVELVSDLLANLFLEQDLISGVTNILNLSLIDGDLLGSLTSGDLSSLLGILNTGSGTLQKVKLLFTTGAVPPVGNLTVKLHASASLAVASVDFDNVSLRHFNLVATPNPPGSGNVGDNYTFGRPVVRPKLPRVIRHTTRPRMTIKGTAAAFGEGNSIQAVYVKMKGKGIPAKDRNFKKVKGQSSWVARVRVPVSKRTRVVFMAQDAFGATSFEQFVRVSRN